MTAEDGLLSMDEIYLRLVEARAEPVEFWALTCGGDRRRMSAEELDALIERYFAEGGAA